MYYQNLPPPTWRDPPELLLLEEDLELLALAALETLA